MQFENNVWEVVFIVVLAFFLSWPAVNAAKGGIAKENLSVAVRNYILPFGCASFLFLLGGFEWWIATAAAICLIIAALLTAHRGRMHIWFPHLPLYTRIVAFLITLAPVVAVFFYYSYAPWEDGEKTLLYTWLGGVIFAVGSAFYEVHFRISRKAKHHDHSDN